MRGRSLFCLFAFVVVAGTPALAKETKQAAGQQTTPRGLSLMRAYQCMACHTIDGKGADGGVPLDRKPRSRDFIIQQLLDPEQHVARNPRAFSGDPNLMPDHQLSAEESASIADYLIWHLRSKSSAAKTKTRTNIRSNRTVKVETSKHK